VGKRAAGKIPDRLLLSKPARNKSDFAFIPSKPEYAPAKENSGAASPRHLPQKEQK
jgi:hypothetical protein